MTNELYPVILSGGAGTRMWPASRESHPKQLLSLVGERTMLQDTALRMKGFSAHVMDPIVVTNEEYRFLIAEQLRQIGMTRGRIVLEPMGRNTAPAMQLAALVATRDGSDPILLVMPADHVMRDVKAFQAAMAVGMDQASSGAMVTFGVVPDKPETGYGYILKGKCINTSSTAYQLAAFVEKPDAARAKEYVESGEFLWNSGIFMMRASVWMGALEKLNPVMARVCADAVAGAKHDLDFDRVDASIFAACPSDSIDYAVMEKIAKSPELGRAVIVPLSAGWSDVGAWDALWDVSEKDMHGNAIRGDALLEDSSDSLVFAESRVVAGLGLKDMIVVETPDAVMVAHKSRTQDVKKLVSRLKGSSRSLAEKHRKVYRPWGWYDSIDFGERFQVKRIQVNPGATLSLQKHHHRAEHWVVVKGTAEITCDDKVLILSEDQSTYIPLGSLHRLANPGKVPLEIIEIQSGSYLGEDDIVRFEDKYGRDA